MAQNNFGTFEEQLKKDADQLQFKPSAKVWQGVENSLNSSPVATSAGAVSNIAKSLLSNWILNIMVPVVVLVGGGSFFYINYQQNTPSEAASTASSKENNATVVKSENQISNIQKAEQESKNTESISHAVVDNGITISDNQNNANAVNYSLGIGYTNSNKTAITTASSNVSGNTITDSEHYGSSNSAIFTPSDIEKISKKENEKSNPTEYKERNLKSVDFKD
jgi:hypothetical protein